MNWPISDHFPVVLPRLKNPLPILLTSAVLLMVGCKEKKDNFQKKGGGGPAIVDVIIAQTAKVSSRVEVNGTVVANEYAELKPEVSGLLTYLNIPEGKTVEKGTIIAKINNADLIAQQNKQKVQLNLAEVTQERLKKLIDLNGVNQADYDAAINTTNTLKADIAYYQALIDKTILKAPFTGVIGLRKVSEGSYVTPSTTLATIQQLSQLRVDFTVPEVYQQYISKGGSVGVSLNNQSTESARIIALEPQVNQSTRNITVRAVLSNSKDASPGAFAKVYLTSNTDKSAILVPANCIIPEAKSKKIVTVKNGLAQYVVVETGDRQADFVEVTSGVAPGDTVVVSGVLFTKPDSPVKVRSVRNLKSEG